MSHEIRTPLNAIIGYSDLAEHNIDDREKVLDYIKKISMSSEHLLSLINEILDVSRVESGRLELHNEVFSFSALLAQINTMIGSQCANKGLTFNPNIVGAVSRSFIGDEMKLKEVLINILSNAVKYTPYGGTISFSVEQVFSTSQEVCTLKFTIKDTGIGMSEEFLPKLFDTFSQEDDSNPNQYGSTGLGMVITKNIVDLMNGEIHVESKKGEGSTFTVILPLKDAHEGFITNETVADNSGKSDDMTPEQDDLVERAISMKGYRALIVEDMAINAELLGAILDMKGIEHEWAEDGQIAVDMFTGRPENYYDVILMDIRMPVMDGLAATRAIRALDLPDAGTIPIIAMSANAFDEDKEQSMQAGMNEHLSKPVDMNQLFEVLEKYI